MVLIDAARGARVDLLPHTLTHSVYTREPFTLTHGGVRPDFWATMTVFPEQRIVVCLAVNSDYGYEAVKPWLGLLGMMARACRVP